jgi:hypothetical protein
VGGPASLATSLGAHRSKLLVTSRVPCM